MTDNVPIEVKEEYFRGQKILKKGDHYYCSECHQEIPIHKSCPICKTEIDWDRVMFESRRMT
jgi:hypothetical protein